MAPALRGPSYEVTCGDCAFRFRCDAEHVPADRLAACPNCGYTQNELDRARLLLARARRHRPLAAHATSAAARRRRRLQCAGRGRRNRREARGRRAAAATRDSRRRHLCQRKRHFARRSPNCAPCGCSCMTTTISRARRRTCRRVGRGSGDQSQWRAKDSGFELAAGGRRLEKRTGSSTSIGLARPIRGCAALPPAIRDNDSYNQGETRRPLNAGFGRHADLPRARRAAKGTGLRRGRWRPAIRNSHRAAKARRRQFGRTDAARTAAGRSTSRRGGSDVEFGLCDQQVLLAVQGRTIVRHAVRATCRNIARNATPAGDWRPRPGGRGDATPRVA